MKFNVHYASVKFILNTLLNDNAHVQSQTVASLSQFINDHFYESTSEWNVNQLPNSILERHNLYKKIDKNNVKLILAPTNVDDKDKIEQETYQVHQLIPFTYFPSDKHPDEDKREYSVKQIFLPNTHPIIAKYFNEAKELYNLAINERNINLRDQALRRFGILLHIVINSIAYYKFNGFKSKINSWEIKSVENQRTSKNLTAEYVKQAEDMPNVGRYKTATLLEDYNRRFYIHNTQNSFDDTGTTNDLYESIGKVIYDFSCSFFDLSSSVDIWNTNYLPKLQTCWSYESNDIDEICEYWSKQTYLNYEYSYAQVLEEIKTRVTENDKQPVFDYLLFTDDLVKTAKDLVTPRSKGSQTDTLIKDPIKYKVSHPEYDGDQVILTITVQDTRTNVEYESVIDDSEKKEMIAELITEISANGMFIESFTDEYSSTKKMVQEIKQESYKNDVTLTISTTYKCSGKKDKIMTKEIKLLGTNTLIQDVKVINPISSSDSKIIVVNGGSSEKGDYVFANNAVYTSQIGDRQLDIFTPFELELTLHEGLILQDKNNTVSLSVKDESSESKYDYCNNVRYTSIKQDEDTENVHIKLADEWKNHIPIKSDSSLDVTFSLHYELNLEVYSTVEQCKRHIKYSGPSNPIKIKYLETN